MSRGQFQICSNKHETPLEKKAHLEMGHGDPYVGTKSHNSNKLKRGHLGNTT